jgi:CRISPR type III-B/RAMP module-associated protein Cmr5
MATLEQNRANFALGKVQGIRNNAEKAKFRTQLLKLPARLHANGLGQTVAFYLSSGEPKPEWQICKWLEEWLHQTGMVYGIVPFKDSPLIECITGSKTPSQQSELVENLYRQASAEARALSTWLKRFAEAFIEGERG